MQVLSEQHATVVLALVLLAHAWAGRIQASPAVLSALGWLVNLMAVLALGACWVRC